MKDYGYSYNTYGKENEAINQVNDRIPNYPALRILNNGWFIIANIW